MKSNIYKQARRSTGKTQKEAIAGLFVGERTLQGYEGGRINPSDDMVARMADFYQYPWLKYQYMKEELATGKDVLPAVTPMGLCQSVLFMQKELGDVQKLISKLIEIAADGIVAMDEQEQFNTICREAEEAAGSLLTLALYGRMADVRR